MRKLFTLLSLLLALSLVACGSGEAVGTAAPEDSTAAEENSTLPSSTAEEEVSGEADSGEYPTTEEVTDFINELYDFWDEESGFNALMERAEKLTLIREGKSRCIALAAEIAQRKLEEKDYSDLFLLVDVLELYSSYDRLQGELLEWDTATMEVLDIGKALIGFLEDAETDEEYENTLDKIIAIHEIDLETEAD